MSSPSPDETSGAEAPRTNDTSGAGAPRTNDTSGAGAPRSSEIAARVQAELPRVEILARVVAKNLGVAFRLDDLVSYGHDGLLQAARSFDEALGVPFHRWASYRIRGAILDGVRRGSSLPRSAYARIRMIEAAARAAEQADEDDAGGAVVSPEDADEKLAAHLAGMATAAACGLIATGTTPDDATAPDDALALAETAAVVRAALGELPEKERHLLQRHYFEDVPLDAAAKEIGLSKSWASRLHARAIEALWRNLKRRGVTE